MKHLFRITSLILASLMLICAFIGCADNTQTEDTTKAVTQPIQGDESTADSNLDENGYLKDDLPSDLNFDTDFVCLVWDDVEHEEFESDGADGDLVLSSIYKRNCNVQERLGIRLSYLRQNGDSDFVSKFAQFVGTDQQTSAHQFQAIGCYSLSTVLCMTKGYLLNMNNKDNCPYINFEQPWWSENLISQGTFYDKLYFASGDISRNALEMMYVCFVNTDILTNHNLENPQKYVESNDWTYDKFIEMCKGIYEGDGTKNETTDTFGYMCSGIHNDPWFYGSGALICEKDADGALIVSPSYSGERVINTLSKFITLFQSQDGIYTAEVKHQTAFAEGRLLFMTDRCRVSHKKLANYDVNFVIVPCPKYDKDQENYYTVMGNPFTLYAIPKDCEDTKCASAFIECMASEGYRVVTPAVFELSLKTKYVDDPTSAEMYDIVRANLVFDLGRMLSADLSSQGAFRSAIKSTSNNWGALSKTSAKSMTTKLKTVNKTLYELE